MKSLLPLNSTQLERAMEAAFFEKTIVPLRDLYNPDTCPVHLLPHLAWAWSVDRWDYRWSEATKRAAIKASFYIHKHKGTIGAIRRVVEPLGYLIEIVEWFKTVPEGVPGKVADGKLLVMPRQGGQTASGKAFGAVTLTRRDLSRWQFSLGDRNSHKAVATKHQNKKDGKLEVVTIDNDDSPDGLPAVHTDRHIYPNKTAAEAAAKARLSAFNRSTADVRFEMPGRTDIFAERPILAQGFKEGLDGEYLADSVEQVFTQSGWSTTVECNAGKAGKSKGKKKKGPKPPLKVVNIEKQ